MSKSKSESGKRVSDVHHDFFYNFFKLKVNATSLMRARCPKALFDIVDWRTLKLVTPVVSAEQFNTKRGDLFFCAKLRNSDRLANIILLFEHKSFNDKKLVKQVAQYQFLRYLEDDFTSLIIPIVVRHARSDKRKSIQFRDQFADISKKNLDVIMDYAVNFKCVLIDLLELDRNRQVAETNIGVAIKAMTIVREFKLSDWLELLDLTKYVSKELRQRTSNSNFGVREIPLIFAPKKIFCRFGYSCIGGIL